MLTLVINPGGTARNVKIDEALYHLGFDIRRPDHCPPRTSKEKRRHRRARHRRRQEQREANR